MDYQTKNEIKNEVKKLFSQYQTTKENKKLFETKVEGLQQITNERYDEAVFRGNIVKQAIVAKATLDSEEATKIDVQNEISRLIAVRMAAPGVKITYYTQEQEG